MSTIFCDNDGCIFSDGCGFCDCDKLSIVDGVCEGSYGRNASDDDERLKAENAKLRKLVRDMWCDIPKSESCGWDMDANCCTDRDECGGECSYWYRMRELGIEVK